MVLLRNSILWKHAQMSSMIGCRDSNVVHYKEIYEKSSPIKSSHRQCPTTLVKMGNLQHTITIYHFSLLMPCFELTRHSAMGYRKVPRSRHCTSHAGCFALVIQCTEYIYISFPESLVHSVLMKFITGELTASFLHRHGDLK